jgi:predicted dinucleotide-binding enzyme
MNIGIIGSGNVGGALGVRWAKNGHLVVFSSRNPQSIEMAQLTARAGAKARAASVCEAASASEVLLLATPWAGARDAIAGAGDLTGKIVIDAINPLLPDLSGLELGTTTSAAEQVAAWQPGARVVKAFNTVGANIMENPEFEGGKVFLPYCGDDRDAKAKVDGLATELGFEAFDVGSLQQARLLEPFAMLWISIAFGSNRGNREFSFAMLRRPVL